MSLVLPKLEKWDKKERWCAFVCKIRQIQLKRHIYLLSRYNTVLAGGVVAC